MTNESLENGILEIRRGVIVLAVLSRLNQEQYGYSLIKSLAGHTLSLAAAAGRPGPPAVCLAGRNRPPAPLLRAQR